MTKWEKAEKEKHDLDLAVLMADRCKKSEAEAFLKRGTTVYENPKEWIDTLKACNCYEGETLEDVRSGKCADTQIVEYEGREYLVDYVN